MAEKYDLEASYLIFKSKVTYVYILFKMVLKNAYVICLLTHNIKLKTGAGGRFPPFVQS
jgi:hypothetical protein